MISESSYWKDDLLKQARSLRRRLLQKRWSETSIVRTEQTVMLGFYSIRKLAEAYKISDSIRMQNIPLTSYLAVRPVTLINNMRIDTLYDLENSHQVSKDLIFVCNQFIHSYVFMISFQEDNSFQGVFFSSDRERNNRLYMIEAKQIIDVFEQVGDNYPSAYSAKFDERQKDYNVTIQ